MLGVKARKAMVVEGTLAGVETGHNSGFGLVIGVDRKGDAAVLGQQGADIVVCDLKKLLP
jgi:beta-phosphoglucomutase-like phosphatase (HAD superfamily)